MPFDIKKPNFGYSLPTWLTVLGNVALVVGAAKALSTVKKHLSVGLHT